MKDQRADGGAFTFSFRINKPQTYQKFSQVFVICDDSIMDNNKF